MPFWTSLELRMMEVVETTGAIRRAKPHSNHHHQHTSSQLFTGRMPFLSPDQQCQSTEGNISWTGLWTIHAVIKVKGLWELRYYDLVMAHSC